MNNNLEALNNYLFEELERLNDDETLINEDSLEKELKRSKAITQVSSQIVQNAKVILDAKKHCDTFGYEENNFYKLNNPEKNNKNTYEEFRKQL